MLRRMSIFLSLFYTYLKSDNKSIFTSLLICLLGRCPRYFAFYKAKPKSISLHLGSLLISITLATSLERDCKISILLAKFYLILATNTNLVVILVTSISCSIQSLIILPPVESCSSSAQMKTYVPCL
jgi:hypothetical protein